MRDLSKSDKNVIKIQDAISNSDIELYYRTPTTQEFIAYQAKLIKRRGDKIIFNIFETRLEMGLKILTGFREGDFGIDGKIISSDPTSPNYQENWKELIKESASDIIAAFAFTVFEGVRIGTPIDIEMEEEAEEALPFQKSSEN